MTEPDPHTMQPDDARAAAALALLYADRDKTGFQYAIATIRDSGRALNVLLAFAVLTARDIDIEQMRVAAALASRGVWPPGINGS